MDKWRELTNKLWKLRAERGKLNEAVNVLKDQISRSPETARESRANLISLLAQKEDLSDAFSELLRKVLYLFL